MVLEVILILEYKITIHAQNGPELFWKKNYYDQYVLFKVVENCVIYFRMMSP